MRSDLENVNESGIHYPKKRVVSAEVMEMTGRFPSYIHDLGHD